MKIQVLNYFREGYEENACQRAFNVFAVRGFIFLYKISVAPVEVTFLCLEKFGGTI
jgi:hypothetical protein